MQRRLKSRLQRDRPCQIRRQDFLISLTILLASVTVYFRVLSCGFVNFDDGEYVFANPHLRDGFRTANLKWLLLSFDPDNWFPVTRLSLLLDYSVFGLHAGWYHAENVILHGMAALLLFGFLRCATGRRWPSAFVALAFVLHPLHVESVAWVAERKDVLCALFWFAALWAWLRYTQRPGLGGYVAAVALFALGLMSKPMIVTFPFVLLLLDVWPLRRAFSRKLIYEKIPFFVLSTAAIVLTLAAQHNSGALQQMDVIAPMLRMENAPISVAAYLGNTLWPYPLWNPHAYPTSVPAWEAIAAALGILMVSALVLHRWRTWPWLAVGWFWFLGTLIPVIGLVQAGPQPRSDRYMYVPMVGLLIILAWGVPEAAAWLVRDRDEKRYLSVLAAGACIAMASLTWVQTGYWRDTDTLFDHAIASDDRNYRAWIYRAHNLEVNPDAAPDVIAYYRIALGINPGSAEAHNLLGIELTRLRRYDEAVSEYRAALRSYPRYAVGHYDLGDALMLSGHQAEAVHEWRVSLAINPDLTPAHYELARQLLNSPGHLAEGIEHLEAAVRINPDFALAQYNLGNVLMNEPGRLADAIAHFTEALRVRPDYLQAHVELANALLRIPGREVEAISHLEAAEQIQPDPERRKLLDRLELESGASPP